MNKFTTTPGLRENYPDPFSPWGRNMRESSESVPFLGPKVVAGEDADLRSEAC